MRGTPIAHKKGGRMQWIIGGLLLIILVAAALAFASKKAEAIPCPGTDPRNCPTYGDSRDWWLQGQTFGLSSGDTFAWQEWDAGPNNTMVEQPEHVVYACSNLEDDDLDGKIDYGNGPGNDTGCSSIQDDDESNSAPEPPAPPPPPNPPPPPPGAPPPPPEWDPAQGQDSMNIDVGNPNLPGPIMRCTSDIVDGLDLDRFPAVVAFHTKNTVHCPVPVAQISTTVCVERGPSRTGYFYPVTCMAKSSEGKIQQRMKVSRRCRATQTRWIWRGEILVYIRDFEGRQGTGIRLAPQWPAGGDGVRCR